MLLDVGDREEVLSVAVTARRERTLFDDRLPEEPRRAPIAILARQLVEPLKTHDFRDLRVGVQSIKRVAPIGQRREQRLDG